MSVKIKKSSKKPTKKAASEKSDVIERPVVTHPLQALRNEIDTLFDGMLSGIPTMRLSRPSFDMDMWRDPFRRFEDTFGAMSKMSPRADLKETDKNIAITVELPGVAEADIDLTLVDNRLTISAEKKEETRKDEDDYHLSERHYGSIKRSFTLPATADPDKAKANFKDGVLSIEVPKKALPKAATKKIPIQK